MSAYIVEHKVINDFLSHLFLAQNMESEKRELLEFYGLAEIPGHEKTCMETLGGNMMHMNAKAVSERYKEQYDPKCVRDYKYIFNINSTVFSALKNLSTWLYQCGEGTILDSKEYEFFEKLKGEMAMKIVRNMKEYSNI